MARLKDLVKFSKKHKINIASIQLDSYRLRNEKLISLTSLKNISLKKIGKCEALTYMNKLDQLIAMSLKKAYLNQTNLFASELYLQKYIARKKC